MCKRKIILGAFVTFINLYPISSDAYASDDQEEGLKQILKQHNTEYKPGDRKHNLLEAEEALKKMDKILTKF